MLDECMVVAATGRQIKDDEALKTKVLANGFLRLEAPRWHIGALWVSDTGADKVYLVDIGGAGAWELRAGSTSIP